MGARSVSLIATALALAAWAAPAAAACKLVERAELPVTMSGSTAVVAAKINGADARFTVDTGAVFSMIDPASATKFGLSPEPLPPGWVVTGVTGEAKVKVARVKELGLVGQTLGGFDFLIGEHQIGDTDGLLGENLLGDMDAEFDLANGVIRLMTSDGCGGKALAYWLQGGTAYAALPIDPIETPSLRIRGTATLNGRKIDVVFDTGSPRSVLTASGARKAGIKLDDPSVIDTGLTGGIGSRMVRSWIAPVQILDIGGEQIKSTRIAVAEIDFDGEDLVIGADFFLSHRIYIAKDQRTLYFTYNGGPVFNLGAAYATPDNPGTGDEPPKDAAGFERRADAFMARREFDKAIADYTQAAQLEPTEAKHYYDRAMAHFRNQEPALGKADIDQALKLKPDYADALFTRADLRMADKDQAGAFADFDAAQKADPELGARIGYQYTRFGLFDRAIANLDAWIASHPRNEDLAGPLNGRCWARALSNRDLDKALNDCDEALKLWPGLPQILDSRGLVRLRRGDLDKALADYSAALKVDPRIVWSLYGRGIVEDRKGLKDQGAADIAAAVAIDPGIAAEAGKYGVSP